MKECWRTLALLLAVGTFTLAHGLKLSALPDNQWTEVLSATQSPNYGNWTYENDLHGDPVNGVLWLGPGHRGSPQDNIFHAFVPETEAWSTLHTALPPAKACLRHFSFSTQDTALLLLGGAAGHQNSTGTFDAAFQAISDKAWVAYGAYYYAVNKNKWYVMKGPGLNGGSGAYLPRLRYDPVHDIFVYHQSSTMTFSLHHNEWRRLPGAGGPGNREKYAAGVDEKRGIFYLLGGTNQSYCTNPVDEMWAFDPETEAWSKITGVTVNPWENTPACVDYNTSIAYSARSGVNDQRTTQGLWVYKYKTSKNPEWETKLAAPSAWLSLSASSVKVQWVGSAGRSFNIYRAAARPYPKGFVKLNAAPLTGSSYLDNTAAAGTAYSTALLPSMKRAGRAIFPATFIPCPAGRWAWPLPWSRQTSSSSPGSRTSTLVFRAITFIGGGACKFTPPPFNIKS